MRDKVHLVFSLKGTQIRSVAKEARTFKSGIVSRERKYLLDPYLGARCLLANGCVR